VPPSPLDKRTDLLVVPLSRDERRRLEAWAHDQEREASQAIRYALRSILAPDQTTNETPATLPARDSAGAREKDGRTRVES
jgi:hypothetical protein